MGPIENRPATQRYGQEPSKYCKIFKEWKTTRVIRLNEAKYNRDHFLKAGIEHNDLFFIDGSTPPDKIVNEFM